MTTGTSPTQMLHEMCHEILNAADVRAICKSRGFSAAEAASRSLFEHVFLSSTGVAGALRSLSEAEVATLHLLYLADQAVDVTFFERLYGERQTGLRAYGGTFTQQFKPIFEAIQRNLVRKGVLLIGAARSNSPTKTKMELWRFRLPAEFAPFLPGLFQPRVLGHEGAATDDRLRAELRRLAREDRTNPQRRPLVLLESGNLTINSHPFSLAAVREWRRANWEAGLLRAQYQEKNLGQTYQLAVMNQGYPLSEQGYQPSTPLQAIVYAFAQLGHGEWIAPEQLNVLLDLAYAGQNHPSAATICQAGWDAGCLARQQVRDAVYYRPADLDRARADEFLTAGAQRAEQPDSPSDEATAADRQRHDRPSGPSDEAATARGQRHDRPSGPSDEALARWLPTIGGRVYVDLEHVPYDLLEHLNHVADLTIAHGRLQAMPSLVKLVPAWATLRDHPLLRYLRAQSAAFGDALARLDAQWGRLIIHEHLLVARITDLSLRVTLQQALRGDDGAGAAQPVFLADDYVAFPRARLGEIERLVKRAGHVIRTVRAT